MKSCFVVNHPKQVN